MNEFIYAIKIILPENLFNIALYYLWRSYIILNTCEIFAVKAQLIFNVSGKNFSRKLGKTLLILSVWFKCDLFPNRIDHHEYDDFRLVGWV